MENQNKFEPRHLGCYDTQAESTPPVIFSRETRANLVFMIEAKFSPADAAELRPGQPVGVEVK